MADIRIKDLPLATGPTAPAPADVVAIDGVTTRQTPLSSLADVINPAATQAEAEAGTNAVKRMTPLTTYQAILKQVSSVGISNNYNDLDAKPLLGTAAEQNSTAFATANQGTKADSAMQPGAFGIGGGYPLISGTGALDNVTVSGGVRVQTANVADVNGPPGALGGVIWTEVFSAANAFQRYSEITGSGRTWTRVKSNTWGGWKLDRYGDDTVYLEEVPGFDPTNAHVALAAVASQYTGRSLRIHFLAKDYTFKASTVFSCRNVKLTAEPGNKLIITNDITVEQGAFEFGTQALLEPTGVMRQRISNSLVVGARSCVVPNAGAYSRGDVATIVSGSGSGSGEYWFGISGQNGFERARKTEMVEIEHVDYVSNTVYFMAPLIDSYNCVSHIVELRRMDTQGDSFEAEGLNWYGSGGGNTHDDVSTPSSGPRGFNVWGFKRVSYKGGSIRNFPRFFGMFYNCMFGGVISGVDVDGWASEDSTNFKTTTAPIDNNYRSVWFTGFFICGGMNWTISGNNYRNMRRLCDIDRGPVFPRNVIFDGNTADNCEYVMSGHVGEDITYTNNVGIRCRFGLMTRARNTKAHGNKIQCERYGMQAGPIAGSGITWDANTANAGTLEFIDNTVEVSDGEYFATYLSFNRMVLKGNTCYGSKNMAREGFAIQAVVMRNLLIEGNSIELPDGSAANCIYVGDNFNALQIQDGVSIDNNTLRGGAQGIRLRGVIGGNGLPNSARSKNIVIGGGNKYIGHSLRDIRFEQGAYDGARIRVNPGQSFGERSTWPRVSLGSDMRRWSEIPLCDMSPTEKPNGEFIGFVNAPHDAAGANIPFTTMRLGQKYWNVINPGSGQPSFFLIGQDGTRGTLQTGGGAGVTGSIASGQATLTVNDAANIFTGCYLNVAGSGFTGARVIGVVGNVVTLDTNATTTVSGAAVSFRNSSILGAAVAS